MPFINVKTNTKLDDTKKRNIKSRISDIISILPGKSDRYLMLAVEDDIDMMFHRDAESNMAMVEVKLFGAATKDAYQRLTKAICNILSDEAGVNGENCYVKFGEVKYWGYNGFMF
jgi:phenylpyruvate tautomerase PptA (4-oxalocrotonate tautomerase family)